MRLPDFLRGFKPEGSVEDYAEGSPDRAKALTLNLISWYSLFTNAQKHWLHWLDRARKEGTAETLSFQEFEDYVFATIARMKMEGDQDGT